MVETTTAQAKAAITHLSQVQSAKVVNYEERLRAYGKLLERSNRELDTITQDISLVRSFLSHISASCVPFRSDTLNEYLYSHYNTYHSRKRAGNEIVRFSIQALGMSEGQITFIKPIKPVGGDEKIVMSATDNNNMIAALQKVKKFELIDDGIDRYRAALLLVLCIGCRPNEACKARADHFSYDKAAKQFQLDLPKEITKTSEDYSWKLPVAYNNVWKAIYSSNDQLERLDYDKLRELFIKYEKELGIKTEFTMKSSRKMVATKEYAAHVRKQFIKEGGKSI